MGIEDHWVLLVQRQPSLQPLCIAVGRIDPGDKVARRESLPRPT